MGSQKHVLRGLRPKGNFGSALRRVCAKNFIWRAGVRETNEAELHLLEEGLGGQDVPEVERG